MAPGGLRNAPLKRSTFDPGLEVSNTAWLPCPPRRYLLPTRPGPFYRSPPAHPIRGGRHHRTKHQVPYKHGSPSPVTVTGPTLSVQPRHLQRFCRPRGVQGGRGAGTTWYSGVHTFPVIQASATFCCQANEGVGQTAWVPIWGRTTELIPSRERQARSG